MATLRLLQTGTLGLTGTETSENVTLGTSLLDATKAFLVFTVSSASLNASQFQVSGNITNTTTIQFSRWVGQTGNDIVIRWYVAEFSAGVSVQRGSIAQSATTVNVTLGTAVDLSKTFPVISFKLTGATISADDFVRPKITTTTNLELTANTAQASSLVEWQIVQYDACTVQLADLTWASGSTSVTKTVTAVNLAKTWLLTYVYSSSGSSTSNPGQKMTRAYMSNSTTFYADRLANGVGTFNIMGYIVEFTDNTKVWRGDLSFNSTDVSLTTATITGLNIANAFAVTTGGLYLHGGTSDNTTSASANSSLFTLTLQSGPQMVAERGAALGFISEFHYNIVEFITNINYPVSIVATRTIAPALLRKGGKFPAGTKTITRTISRATVKKTAAIRTAASALGRAAGKKLATTRAAVGTLQRLTGKKPTTTRTVGGSILRVTGKRTAAVRTAAGLLGRSAGKKYAATSTRSGYTKRAAGKKPAALSSITRVLKRAAGKKANASRTISGTYRRAVSRLVVASILMAGFMSKGRAYFLSLVASVSTSASRRANVAAKRFKVSSVSRYTKRAVNSTRRGIATRAALMQRALQVKRNKAVTISRYMARSVARRIVRIIPVATYTRKAVAVRRVIVTTILGFATAIKGVLANNYTLLAVATVGATGRFNRSIILYRTIATTVASQGYIGRARGYSRVIVATVSTLPRRAVAVVRRVSGVRTLLATRRAATGRRFAAAVSIPITKYRAISRRMVGMVSRAAYTKRMIGAGRRGLVASLGIMRRIVAFNVRVLAHLYPMPASTRRAVGRAVTAALSPHAYIRRGRYLVAVGMSTCNRAIRRSVKVGRAAISPISVRLQRNIKRVLIRSLTVYSFMQRRYARTTYAIATSIAKTRRNAGRHVQYAVHFTGRRIVNLRREVYYLFNIQPRMRRALAVGRRSIIAAITTRSLQFRKVARGVLGTSASIRRSLARWVFILVSGIPRIKRGHYLKAFAYASVAVSTRRRAARLAMASLSTSAARRLRVGAIRLGQVGLVARLRRALAVGRMGITYPFANIIRSMHKSGNTMLMTVSHTGRTVAKKAYQTSVTNAKRITRVHTIFTSGIHISGALRGRGVALTAYTLNRIRSIRSLHITKKIAKSVTAFADMLASFPASLQDFGGQLAMRIERGVVAFQTGTVSGAIRMHIDRGTASFGKVVRNTVRWKKDD